MKFGGGESAMAWARPITNAAGAANTVITNTVIVDWTGIYKADVALKAGHRRRRRQGERSISSRAATIVVGWHRSDRGRARS